MENCNGENGDIKKKQYRKTNAWYAAKSSKPPEIVNIAPRNANLIRVNVTRIL